MYLPRTQCPPTLTTALLLSLSVCSLLILTDYTPPLTQKASVTNTLKRALLKYVKARHMHISLNNQLYHSSHSLLMMTAR